MIQEIFPHIFDNSYRPRSAAEDDFVLCFFQDTVLLDPNGKERMFPTKAELSLLQAGELVYLFELDGQAFFLWTGELPQTFLAQTGRFEWAKQELFRTVTPQRLAFCGMTAGHLYRWYRDHAFCGRCGGKTRHKQDERALLCPACGKLEFPTLSPAVIVAITDGDRLLLTRYANRPYRRWALVAGFCEIGETLEETVRREVLEEVGLRVTDIRYYKSQPWGYSQSLLAGFFARLDGSDAITLEEAELAEAVWTPRDKIEPPDSAVSLTAEMIEAFRTGTVR